MEVQTEILKDLYLELKRWYRKRASVPYNVGQYDWSFDVTNKVRQVIPDAKSAYLVGWYRILKYKYLGTKRPPKRSIYNIVEGWKNGIEVALLHIPQGWYYVYVPCKLIVVTNNGVHVFPIKENKTVSTGENNKSKILLALGFIFGLYFIKNRR